MPTRAEDLVILGLSSAEVDASVIKKAYYKLAKLRHPDKGGTKESFQTLVNAYERLEKNTYGPTSHAPRPAGPSSYTPPSYSYDNYGDDDDDDDYREYAYGWHHDFFGGSGGFEDFYHRYQQSAEERQKRRARQRARDVKDGYDWRDSATGEATCMTCEENDSITREDALANGLRWKEYKAHPERLRTCWACKNSHDSVMTEAQAGTKFKVLKGHGTFFGRLRRERRSFHHRPEHAGGMSRNSEYFWVKDLQREAKRLGWKPRGAKAAERAAEKAAEAARKAAEKAAKEAAKEEERRKKVAAKQAAAQEAARKATAEKATKEAKEAAAQAKAAAQREAEEKVAAAAAQKAAEGVQKVTHGSKRKRGATAAPKQLKAQQIVEAEDIWAQCDLCDKWRLLPDGSEEPKGERWYCSMNPDRSRAACKVPEEDY